MLDNQVYFMQMQLNMMSNMLLMMSSLLAKSTNTGTSTVQTISLFDALNPPDGVNSVAKVTLAFNSKVTSSKLATCPVATFAPTMAPVEKSVGTSLGLSRWTGTWEPLPDSRTLLQLHASHDAAETALSNLKPQSVVDDLMETLAVKQFVCRVVTQSAHRAQQRRSLFVRRRWAELVDSWSFRSTILRAKLHALAARMESMSRIIQNN